MTHRLALSLIFTLLSLSPACAQDTTIVTPSSPAVTTTPDATIITQPGETVITTVRSPQSDTVTKIVTTGGHSVMGKQKDGTRLEMDSDGSVYQVYSDGARVKASDGIHVLLDGSTITVKDGKRIP